MTTTVKVITHDWPVEVTTTDQVAGGDDVLTVERVEHTSERQFYLTATRSIGFRELPRAGEAGAEPAGEDGAAAG